MSPAPPSSASDSAVLKYMPARHVDAFKRAAARFHVWILLRRGNPKSLRWIGIPGYGPKMLDCKAKTAEFDVNGDGSTAGLVASPILLPQAFGEKKLKKALKEWEGFEGHLYTFNPKTNIEADKAGKHYTLQLDKNNIHYGCVMYKPVFKGQGEYIHADYDLYAIVPSADPTNNTRVSEYSDMNAPLNVDTALFTPNHSRSPLLRDVQYFLKAAGVLPNQDAGSPMVRHGEQETFKTDWDDTLDVFWPDGKSVTELDGPTAIQEFYRTVLRGRKQFGKGTVATPAGGKWERT